MTEDQMQEAMHAMFVANGEESHREIGLFSRVVDIVVLRDSGVWTYELKLKNWRKAFEQAENHQICSDFANVVLPASTSTQVLNKAINKATRTGIGLAVYDGNTNAVTTIVEPMKSNISPHAQEMWRERFLAAVKQGATQ